MPATGYGYIRRGPPLDGIDGVDKVAAFVEKPDVATAERYIADGYLWNSGNFMMQAATALAEVATKRCRRSPKPPRRRSPTPKIVGNVVELAAEPFAARPKISFDHARDGEDRSRGRRRGRLSTGRTSAPGPRSGKPPPRTMPATSRSATPSSSTRPATMSAPIGPLVGVVGLEDVVVVASDDAVLVAPRHRSDEVKTLVAEVNRARGSRSTGNHARHYRPWGYYQSLDVGETHQVKRIVVNPGGRLSLQRHERRSEHWTIVQGSRRGHRRHGDVRILSENQSVFIPAGCDPPPGQSRQDRR